MRRQEEQSAEVEERVSANLVGDENRTSLPEFLADYLILPDTEAKIE